MAAEDHGAGLGVDAAAAAGAQPDPLGFHRLQAMQRRCGQAPPAVRAALQPRIAALAAGHAAALARAAPAPRNGISDVRPLAILVAEMDARRAGHDGNAHDAPSTAAPQPPALRQARALYNAVRTERQLRRSLEAPREDTGPLNSARLVSRMLHGMGEASPGYLAQLVAYVDVLSELEHWLGPVPMAESAAPPAGRKPARRAPAKRKPR